MRSLLGWVLLSNYANALKKNLKQITNIQRSTQSCKFMSLALWHIRQIAKMLVLQKHQLLVFLQRDSLRKLLDVGSTYRGSLETGKTYVNSEHMISLSYCCASSPLKQIMYTWCNRCFLRQIASHNTWLKPHVSNMFSLSQPNSNQFKQLQSFLC